MASHSKSKKSPAESGETSPKTGRRRPPRIAAATRGLASVAALLHGVFDCVFRASADAQDTPADATSARPAAPTGRQALPPGIACNHNTIDFYRNIHYTLAEWKEVPMAGKRRPPLDCVRIELDGVRYVILRESALEGLCRQAGLGDAFSTDRERSLAPGLDLDRATLAGKLRRRRQAAGLSQAALARRAGVRPETLNRIERGHSTPDFATVRKLVVAMNAAESESLDPAGNPAKQPAKEPDDVDRE